MSSRRSYTKPADASAAHRRMADAMFRPPARGPLPDAPDTTWHGTASISASLTISGTLEDRHGWVLALLGTAPDRDTLALFVSVRTPGILLVAHDDHAVRSDLTERLDAVWPLRMTRVGERGWTGAVDGLSWRLCVTGTRVAAGRLGLNAVGERVGHE